MKLTDLKGCEKPLVTFAEHSVVFWRWRANKSNPREMGLHKPSLWKTRYCGTYTKSWGSRVYLYPECIVKNGLKW